MTAPVRVNGRRTTVSELREIDCPDCDGIGRDRQLDASEGCDCRGVRGHERDCWLACRTCQGRAVVAACEIPWCQEPAEDYIAGLCETHAAALGALAIEAPEIAAALAAALVTA